MFLVLPSSVLAADSTAIATSALEFGGSLGKLLWVSTEFRSNVTQADADQYSKLASQIKEQIEIGRASSSLVKANFDVIATTLAYSSAVDPEPLSKAVTGIAAWGAKKTGDALGQMVLDQTQKQAQGILAKGLQDTGFSPAQLRAMTPDQLRDKVKDLNIGGQKLGDILKDDPESIRMLENHAVDIATDIGVDALARAKGTAADVNAIKNDLAKTKQQLQDYQQQVSDHLTNVETRVTELEQST